MDIEIECYSIQAVFFITPLDMKAVVASHTLPGQQYPTKSLKTSFHPLSQLSHSYQIYKNDFFSITDTFKSAISFIYIDHTQQVYTLPETNCLHKSTTSTFFQQFLKIYQIACILNCYRDILKKFHISINFVCRIIFINCHTNHRQQQ